MIQPYYLHWRCSHGVRPMSCANDIFVVSRADSAKKMGSSYMQKDDPSSQECSTRGTDPEILLITPSSLIASKLRANSTIKYIHIQKNLSAENLGGVRFTVREATVKYTSDTGVLITLLRETNTPPLIMFNFHWRNKKFQNNRGRRAPLPAPISGKIVQSSGQINPHVLHILHSLIKYSISSFSPCRQRAII